MCGGGGAQAAWALAGAIYTVVAERSDWKEQSDAAIRRSRPAGAPGPGPGTVPLGLKAEAEGAPF